MASVVLSFCFMVDLGGIEGEQRYLDVIVLLEIDATFSKSDAMDATDATGICELLKLKMINYEK
jgi:hypothetical protein